MNAGEIRPGDKVLEQTLETMRSTPGEARKFASDPGGYLKSKGVATDGLLMGGSHGELSDKALETVAGGGVCASVGFIACVSVGESAQ